MILTRAGDIERYRAAGLWGHLALDELFLFAARKAPGEMALIDPPDRAEVTGGAPKSLTWGAAAAAVDALAARFNALGLKADDVVAVQMPNIVETYIVMLALFRARLIACPVPPTWREYELNATLSQIAPRALVTAGRIGAFAHADMMCMVASEQMTVRHVLATGSRLPDGVIPLDMPAEGNGRPELPERRDDAANHVATMTFEPFGEALARPVARSHNQWIAAALRHTALAGLKRSDVILSAHLPVSLLPLSAVFVPWILTGARLALHHPFDRRNFADLIAASGATYTLLPAGVLALMEQDFDWSRTALNRLGCVWSAPHAAHAVGQMAPAAGPLPVNDLYAFGEIATYAGARCAGHWPGRIPLGAIGLSDEDGVPSVLETRVRGGMHRAGAGETTLAGTLQVRGAMVPALDFGPAAGRLASEAEAAGDRQDAPFIDTGLQMLVSSATPPAADCVSAREGVVHVGGTAVSTAEIDRLMAGHSGIVDAACFFRPDPLMGARIEAAVVPREGTNVTSEDMRTYLKSRKVAEYKIPLRTIATGHIPRDAEGRVDRARLAGLGV